MDCKNQKYKYFDFFVKDDEVNKKFMVFISVYTENQVPAPKMHYSLEEQLLNPPMSIRKGVVVFGKIPEEFETNVLGILHKLKPMYEGRKINKRSKLYKNLLTSLERSDVNFFVTFSKIEPIVCATRTHLHQLFSEYGTPLSII